MLKRTALALAVAITLPALAMAADTSNSSSSQNVDNQQSRMVQQQMNSDQEYNNEDESWFMRCFRRFQQKHMHRRNSNHCHN